jgi:hypothetical protein
LRLLRSCPLARPPASATEEHAFFARASFHHRRTCACFARDPRSPTRFRRRRTRLLRASLSENKRRRPLARRWRHCR